MSMEGEEGSRDFIDYKNHSIGINVNPYLTTLNKKIGNSSAYFSGFGDYLRVNSSPDFVLGYEDFTIETFFNRISFNNPYPRIIQGGEDWNTNNNWGISSRSSSFWFK